jgi:hypothetical protein
MKPFPISYDAVSNTLQLDEEGGAEVMLGILLKAKFGEAFDPDTLFHRPLADLMSGLRKKIGSAWDGDGPFTRGQLASLADDIVSESWRSGWWSMTRDERVALVQDVIVAPHRLSAEQMTDLMLDVEGALAAHRRIVDAAEGVVEP